MKLIEDINVPKTEFTCINWPHINFVLFKIYDISIEYRFIKISIPYVWIDYSCSNIHTCEINRKYQYSQYRPYMYVLAVY